MATWPSWTVLNRLAHTTFEDLIELARRRRRHHLDAVYEEAVRPATALAAANGLVTEDVTSEEA